MFLVCCKKVEEAVGIEPTHKTYTSPSAQENF
jgi:hypothetical protein